MNTSTTKKLTPRQIQVQEFWKARVDSFSLDDEKKICQAYRVHLIGATDYEDMSRVHAGLDESKDDFNGFYNTISDILKPSEAELEVLVSEGLDFVGFIHMLTKPYGHINNRPSGVILANMVASQYRH